MCEIDRERDRWIKERETERDVNKRERETDGERSQKREYTTQQFHYIHVTQGY